MLTVFLTGLWLGVIFNAAPGAVFAESLRRGITGGFRPALYVQIGSLAGDALWAVLGLAGAAAILTQPQLTTALALAGCAVLLFLGVHGLRAALRQPIPAASKPGTSSGHRSALLAGAAMSIGNVWNVVYWGGAGGAVAGALGTANPAAATSVFFVAFMLSSIAWCFICAGLIAGIRRALSARLVTLVEAGSAVALMIMAITLAVTAVS